MRFLPVTLRVPGNYEDIYLYKGRLYLWTVEHDLLVLNWDALLESVSDYVPREHLAFHWSFARNDYLRSAQFAEMLQDPDLGRDFALKALAIDSARLVIDRSLLASHTVFATQSTVDEITDVLLYNDVLYVGSTSGVYGSFVARNNEESLERVDKIGEPHTVAISARYGTLTGACCEDGLFCWSTLQLDTRPRILYRTERFTREACWLRSDFLTLGEGSFTYFVNERAKKREKGGRRTDRLQESALEGDDSIIVEYGHEVIEALRLIRDPQPTLRTLFTLNNHVYLCAMVGERLQVVRWFRPLRADSFYKRGLVNPTTYHDLGVDVFSGAAIDTKTIVLDTDGGTLILHEDTQEQFLLTPGVNVEVRTFPNSKWYGCLVCSIKEDHALVSCIWPIDLDETLGPR